MPAAAGATGPFRLAVVGGIPIRIDPSWFLVFALLTWSLAAGHFPAEYPGWPAPTYWLTAALTSAAFFASVVLHELGHAWVARRQGIPIRSITLFVFGGVAQIGREPGSPGAEVRMAVAGPLTSLALAVVSGAVFLVMRPLETVAAAMLWLMQVNTMVAVFNLVPGFPLDGGRIVRALVWRWTGNVKTATRTAAMGGRLVAFGLIGLGIFTALHGNVVGGVWMAFIGWFLQNAALASSEEADVKELLRGATVRQVMTRECARVPPSMTLERLVHDEVLATGRRCVLVTDDGRLLGLVTLHEVKGVARERWPSLTATDVMIPLEKLRWIGPEETVLAALEWMDDAGVAQLPVAEGDTLLGLIGREEILHYLRTRAELGL